MTAGNDAVHLEVSAACDLAARAWGASQRLRMDPAGGAKRGALLDALAGSLDARRSEILDTCVAETALTAGELAPEFDRMTGTLRLLARTASDGTWMRPAIDPVPADPKASIGPAHDIRSMLVPLGPAAVFGASNFPLAYGVCGGDTASALAAGCPVIVKEHPAHPRTGRLIAAIASAAVAGAGEPPGLFTYVHNDDPADHAVAEALVRHPAVRAVGFTGSERGGMALYRLARDRLGPSARPDAIPVFAEMGSINPVIITPAAAARMGERLGGMLADSVLLRFGQQCTCPGLIFIPGVDGAGSAIVEAMRAKFTAAAGRDMLAPWIRDAYARRVEATLATAGVREVARGASTGGLRGAAAILLATDLATFNRKVALAEETFGPSTLLVDTPSLEALADVAWPGSLTATVWSDEQDEGELASLARALEAHAGRIIYRGVPTGVRACEAMVHGGPFPASNRPDTTAVGPRAMERWCRPVCWQNAPQAMLPPPLRPAR